LGVRWINKVVRFRGRGARSLRRHLVRLREQHAPLKRCVGMHEECAQLRRQYVAQLRERYGLHRRLPARLRGPRSPYVIQHGP
jgi:hypothetical protein